MSARFTLSDAIAALVGEKRAVGYKYDTEARVLARFEAFSSREFPGLDSLIEASVQAWITAARKRDVKPATLQGLAAPVRELARWLGRRDTTAYLLPTGVLPKLLAVALFSDGAVVVRDDDDFLGGVLI